MSEAYQKVSPRPDDFGRLLDKIGESMAKDFDFSDEVRALKVPTLIVAADADMARRATTSRFQAARRRFTRRRLDGECRPEGGYTLAMLPGLTHYNLGVSPQFAAVALDFLEENSQ